MNIKIIAMGKVKNKSPEMEIMDEYLKRIKGCSVKVMELEVKNFSNSEDKKQKEADLMQKHISSSDYIVCMDEHGENLTSVEFSNVIKKQQGQGGDIVFIIGGAFGIHKSLLDKSNKKIAFGKVTYPHKLLRAMLVEQVYRAFSIINNHPYHKE